MKLTIIVDDNAVYVDGVVYSGLDLAVVPSNVHALQFNDASNAGWIEFVQDDFGNKADNQPITLLPAWATTALTKWDEAKAAKEAKEAADAALAEVAANQPQTSGTQPA
jgi:hypothetical protein